MDAERVYIPIQPEKLIALSRYDRREVVDARHRVGMAARRASATCCTSSRAMRSTLSKRRRAPSDGVCHSTPRLAPLTAAIGAARELGASEQVDVRDPVGIQSVDLLIVTFDKGVVVPYATDDGRILWTRELGAASRFSPAVDGVRAVFAVDDSRAVALRLADGRVEWEQKLDGMLNPPSFARDRMFIGSNTNFLFALDNVTGRIAWKWKTGGDVIGTSADSKGGAYYASLDNVVRAVNRGNGNQRWIKEIPTRPLLTPQVFGDGVTYEEIVVVTGVTSEIDAFAAKNGAVAGMYMPPSDLQGASADRSRPAAVSGRDGRDHARRPRHRPEAVRDAAAGTDDRSVFRASGPAVGA